MMIHGHAAEAEYLVGEGLRKVDDRPYSDIVGDRRGGGATFAVEERPDERPLAVFHFAVPTPSFVEDSPGTTNGRTYRPTLTTIALQGMTSRSGIVRFVHAWERDKRIWASADLLLNGDFRNRWDFRRTQRQEAPNVFDVPDRPMVHGALGISIGFDAGRLFGEQRITFTQVGARFEYIESG